MSETNSESNVIALDYDGAFVIADAMALPRQSIMALLTSGFNHKLGNEVASDVVSEVRKAIKEAKGDPKADVTREEIKAWGEANAEARTKMVARLRKEMFESILDGSVGVRVGTPRAPKLDELARKVRFLAEQEVGATLVGLGKLAKSADGGFVTTEGKRCTAKAPLFTVAAGTFNFIQLVDRRVAQHGGRLKAEAEKLLAAERRAAAKGVTTDGSDDGL